MVAGFEPDHPAWIPCRLQRLRQGSAKEAQRRQIRDHTRACQLAGYERRWKRLQRFLPIRTAYQQQSTPLAHVALERKELSAIEPGYVCVGQQDKIEGR